MNKKKRVVKTIREGISAIIYFEDKEIKGKKKYLILKRKQNWRGWECVKGGCKVKESLKQCLAREIKEETGINKFKPKKTKTFSCFSYEKPFEKDGKKYFGAKNLVYLVKVFSDKIKYDKKEHSGFKWVDKEEALKLLTWGDFRKIFGVVA